MAGTELAWGAVLAVLVAAAVFDLRSRRVPAWLSGGGIAAGVLLGAWNGPPALTTSLAGAAAGGLIFLPFVWRGWLGGADALLLAAVGAWQGWRVALWTAWWTALAGALLALGVWAWRIWWLRRAAAVPDAAAGGGAPARGSTLERSGAAFVADEGEGASADEGATHTAGTATGVEAGAGGRRGVSAVVAAARGEPFPYVPAILAGALLALFFGS